LLPECIVYTLKTALKLNKNVKTRKIANILETAQNIAKSSKFQPKALLRGVLQGITIISILTKKISLLKIERYF